MGLMSIVVVAFSRSQFKSTQDDSWDDFSFDSDSCKPTAQPVYDVKVDSVIGTDLKGNSSHIVTISWFCPLEYRENVEEYYIVFINLNNNSTIYYDAQIPVVPVVRNSHNQSQLGPASQLLLTLEPIVPTTVAVDSTYLHEEKWFTTENAGSVTLTTADQFSPNTRKSLKFSFIGVCVAIGVLLIVLVGVLRVRRNRKRLSTSTTECHAEEFDEMMIGPGVETNTLSRGLIAKQEIPRSNLHIKNELGRGNFGIVCKATAEGIGEGKKTITVAVKMLKDNATAVEKDEILREITTLQEIGKHANILSILGCCTLEEPYFLITEYMKYGDLLHFLWRTKEPRYQNDDPIYSLTEKGYYQIARQIARGMEFLAQNKYVHGDLAARNVLVGEDLVIKISDFGLSNDVYLQGWTALPASRMRAAKWVSLETNLKGLCTIQSDVWSFGIVLYEIATHGETPYPGMSASKVVKAVKEGYRMARPDDCPQSMYAIMKRCWLENPDDRPTFNVLLQKFDRLLSQFADYINEPRPEPFLSRSSEDMPLLQNIKEVGTTKKSVGSVSKKRDTGDLVIKGRRRNNYSTEESALGESTSTAPFDDYMAKNSDVEDFSDEIVFEAMSESDNDEGFFL
ncbi:fibroblast growth factor receptor 3-like [Ptychodera flava]|uniref:fibroblast growth factor receptor 3-like n=1 Tax=Ptychodera flava TaxID=63121 RepID=UPI003969E0F5